jgi:hypothetical protein
MSLCSNLIPESERGVYRRIHQKWQDKFYRELLGTSPDPGEIAFLHFLLSAMEDALPFVKEAPQA